MTKLSKAILVAGVIAIGIAMSGFMAPPHKDGKETYIVKQGDTLWDIAGVYMKKNTYASRDQREFMWGIIEHNYNLFRNRNISQNRHDVTIYPGDELEIVWQERIEEK